MTTHNFLTLDKKIDLINDAANGTGLPQRELSTKYEISKGAMYNILQRKEEYKCDFQTNSNKGVKRKLQDDSGRKIDQAVYSWFIQQRSKNIPLSGPLIQKKAREFAEGFGCSPGTFKASNGWLDKFKNRHCITFRSISGESAQVDPDTVEEWKKRLLILLDSYAENDVYNADETGLFFKLLPNRSMELSKESCNGGKQSKEIYTVLVCATWSGTHKLKPLVIGKSLRPRCFKNMDINKLPVIWKANRTSWMNAAIFTDWIHMINTQMRRENRKILHFLDNAPVHPVDLKLSNVTLIFFPPNTTSKIQPLDQGVTRCFKAYYQSRLLKHIIKRFTVALTLDQVIITALDAINWIEQAWTDVTESTIHNTFHKASFQHRQTINMINNDIDEINEVTINSCELQLSTMKFVKIGDDIPVFNETDNITANLLTTEVHDVQQDQDDETIQEEPSTPTEALEMTRKLHLLACTRQPELHKVVANLESTLIDIYIDSKGNKQTSITDFFRKT